MARIGELNNDLAADYYTRIRPDRAKRRALRELESLGYRHLGQLSTRATVTQGIFESEPGELPWERSDLQISPFGDGPDLPRKPHPYGRSVRRPADDRLRNRAAPLLPVTVGFVRPGDE